MTEITLNISNLMNFTQASKILAISRPTVYEFIKKHKLHPIVIGRNRYLLQDEVERLRDEVKELKLKNQATRDKTGVA